MSRWSSPAADGADHCRVAVPEVEDATVGVAVPQPSSVEGTLEARAGSLAHHQVETECLERGDLATVHVVGEGLRRCLRGGVRLLVWCEGHADRSSRSVGVPTAAGTQARLSRTRQ